MRLPLAMQGVSKELYSRVVNYPSFKALNDGQSTGEEPIGS
jgi:hypothetical protein